MNLTGVALETLGVAFKSNSYSKDDGVFLDEFGGVGKLAGLHDLERVMTVEDWPEVKALGVEPRKTQHDYPIGIKTTATNSELYICCQFMCGPYSKP